MSCHGHLALEASGMQGCNLPRSGRGCGPRCVTSCRRQGGRRPVRNRWWRWDAMATATPSGTAAGPAVSVSGGSRAFGIPTVRLVQKVAPNMHSLCGFLQRPYLFVLLPWRLAAPLMGLCVRSKGGIALAPEDVQADPRPSGIPPAVAHGARSLPSEVACPSRFKLKGVPEPLPAALADSL
jgi:hypothetical protein